MLGEVFALLGKYVSDISQKPEATIATFLPFLEELINVCFSRFSFFFFFFC